MYQAQSAAGNSACLSRQVGACITDDKMNVISKGWNDVPKYGGNLYGEEDFERDHRCKVLGYCSNDKEKIRLTDEIVNKISELKLLKSIVERNSKIKKELFEIIRYSNLKNLIEFSRSVHAEMHAIISGSQLSGSKMIGGKLFCTTYPCHNCARHIVAAGIVEVYYIEPYKKSLCLNLHGDSMSEDEKCENKVRILLFDGVAPRRFLSFFSKSKERKGIDGKILKTSKKLVKPKNTISLQALNTLESEAIHSLEHSKILS